MKILTFKIQNNRRAALDYVFEYSDGRRVCAVFDFRNNTKEYTDTGMEHYESLLFYCVPDFSLESYEKLDDGAFDSAMLTLNKRNTILHTLLTMEREKKLHIERRIAALEYLVLAGTKNGVSGALRGISLDELGRTLLAVRDASTEDGAPHRMPEEHAEIFAREFSALTITQKENDLSKLVARLWTSQSPVNKKPIFWC